MTLRRVVRIVYGELGDVAVRQRVYRSICCSNSYGMPIRWRSQSDLDIVDSETMLATEMQVQWDFEARSICIDRVATSQECARQDRDAEMSVYESSPSSTFLLTRTLKFTDENFHFR